MLGGTLQRRLVASPVVVSSLTSLGYAAVSTLVAVHLVYETPKPVTATPASLGLTFRFRAAPTT